MSKNLSLANRPSIAACVSLLALVHLAGCAPGGPDPARDADGPLTVVATTGMIADTAQRILGEHGTVVALMGPGVDPHLYKASESDVRRLSEADLILYNGLHLEGKMGDILVKLARSRPVVAVSETVPDSELLEPPEFAGQYDPHIWFDVRLWSMTLEPIADALAELRPKHEADFRANAAELHAALLALDAEVESAIDSLPDGRRVLVTAHDAFGYFGRRYGMRVEGIQGISTLAEAGLRDVQRVVDLVVEQRIPSIFVESSVSERAIEAVQAACADAGHEVGIGGQLYSDAMGAAGTPEGTYEGMVRANVATIVEGLR